MEPSIRKVQLPDKTGGVVWSRANLRELSEYCDITLISKEGDKFPSHRLILSVNSIFLQLEIRRSSGPEIWMETVKSEVLLALLTFIYEGR